MTTVIYPGAVYIPVNHGCWPLGVGQLRQAELFLDISPRVWKNSSCNWDQSASKEDCLKQSLALPERWPKARSSTTDQQNLSPTCNTCQLTPKL